MTTPSPRLLDGAMGTELARRGVAIGGPAGASVALDEAPDLVAAIHRAHAEAGADVLTTDTLLVHADDHGLATRCRTAVRLARAGFDGRAGTVAGSFGTLAHLVTDPTARAARYRDVARALLDAGCDLLFVETMTGVDEATRAIEAALHVADGAPVWLSVVASAADRLLAGESFDALAARLGALPLDAVSLGCTAPSVLRVAIDPFAARFAGRVGAVPNLGPPGATTDELALADELAALATRVPLSVVGGCCGTTPAFTERLAAQLGRLG